MIILFRCDVSKREEVFKVAERVKTEIGHPTIVVNNAGIMPCQSFLDHTPETIKKIIDVNVFANIWVCIYFYVYIYL